MEDKLEIVLENLKKERRAVEDIIGYYGSIAEKTINPIKRIKLKIKAEKAWGHYTGLSSAIDDIRRTMEKGS